MKNIHALRSMKGCFKSLAPVPTVLSADMSTQMERDFVSEICEFWESTFIYCPKKSVTEMLSSLAIAFFNYFNLCCFMLPRLAQHSA